MAKTNKAETPLAAETKPAPEKKIEIQEQNPKPWERMEKEDEERLIKKHGEQFEIKGETKKSISEVLQKESDAKKIEFALKWFSDHKDELKEEGLPTDISNDKKISIAMERGAMKELKEEDGDYKKQNREIENLNALRTELENGKVTPEGQFLMLNVLQRKVEEIKEDLEDAKRQGKSGPEIAAKENLLKERMGLRHELAKIALGRDLEKEIGVDSKSGVISKEDHIAKELEGQKKNLRETNLMNAYSDEWKALGNDKSKSKYCGNAWGTLSIDDQNNYLNENWSALSDQGKKVYREARLAFGNTKVEEVKTKSGFDLGPEGDKTYMPDLILALRNQGYNLEENKIKGRFWGRERVEFPGKKPIPAEDFQKYCQELTENFRKNIENSAEKSLSDAWEANQAKINALEEKMKELSNSERAKEEIKKMYEKVKNNLIAEFFSKDIKRNKRGEAELKRIKEEFGGEKGGDVKKLFSNILSEQEKLKGDLDSDQGELEEFFRSQGIEASKDDLEGLRGFYSEGYKSKGGFLEMLLNFILNLIRPVEKPAPSSEQKGSRLKRRPRLKGGR